ncbi:MAG: M48 family metallopeptidase [Myxococcales bacterium]|nr:M48 family metallopeptidase [Myxococcales bacterium]
MGALTQTGRVVLEGIDSRAFEHPADRAALHALRKVPGFDLALRKVFGFVGERSVRYLHLANAVRVGEHQFARVDRIYRDCLEVLDVPERPELFIVQTPIVNAGALGVDKPFIVLNSGAIDLFGDDELRFIIGHELGHVICDHALYKTMLSLLLRVSIAYGVMPIAGVALFGVVAALREWDRKSELTADRAGLLAVQDPEAAFRVQMKMAGGSRVSEMSVDAFSEQADDYDRGGDVLDGVIKLMNLLQRTHPFSALRLRALRAWVEEGGYQAVLDGDYARRGSEQADRRFHEEVLDGARAYRDSARKSEDPLARFFNDLADAGSTVIERARGVMRRD